MNPTPEKLSELRALRAETKRKALERRRQRAAEERTAKLLAQQREICRRVAQGASLMAVCSEGDKRIPTYDRALIWLADYPEFSDAYKAAQRARADALFEEALTISDDARNDWMARNDPNNPGWVQNGEHIARSKLRVDTRKWMVSKLNPSRYGEKLAVEGNPDKPVVVAVTHKIVQVVRQETFSPQEKLSGWEANEDD
jgi:uncharacterized protein (UPF0147 family)